MGLKCLSIILFIVTSAVPLLSLLLSSDFVLHLIFATFFYPVPLLCTIFSCGFRCAMNYAKFSLFVVLLKKLNESSTTFHFVVLHSEQQLEIKRISSSLSLAQLHLSVSINAFKCDLACWQQADKRGRIAAVGN